MSAPSSAGPAGSRRADIQGLRAVAVLGVVAAHVTGWPAGGYLGVDVFFVISGFVITGVLQRASASAVGRPRWGRVLRDFYARRARRILPLALLVLGVTVLVAGWAFSAPRAALVRQDAVWAALFAANWHMAQVGSDYFALGDAPSPVLHFWSLGVEEQFYLVWPALFVATAAVGSHLRTNRRALVGLAALVVAGSVAYAAGRADIDAVTAYYSSFTRAWELGAGALLAALAPTGLRLPAGVRTALSWGGLAVVAVAFLGLGDLTAPWPAALLPVVGALAVLTAGLGADPAGAALLTNPVSRWLGDVSYGVYLWHLPLLVVLSALVPVSPALRVVVVLATLALAATTYALVERPLLDAPGTGGGPLAWRAWWAGHRRRMVAGATAAVCLVVAGLGFAASPVLAGAAADPVDPVAVAVAGPIPAPSAEPAPAPATTPTPTSVASSSTPSPTPTPTVTTAAPVPLGATGSALQAGLSGALAARSWPADLTPSVDQWATTQDKGPGMAACVATVPKNPTSCTFGNPDGPEIDVFGDSLGIPLLAAVVAAYGHDYRVRGMTKIACAVNGVDADFGKDEWAVPCVNHRRAVIDHIKAAKPALVMMVETYAWATKLKSKATGDAAAAEWRAADQAFVDEVTGSAGRVVIVSPSIPGVAFVDCYRPGGSPGRCVTGIPTWWQQTQDAERRVTGATFLDTLPWYCVDGRCPLFTTMHDTVLKGDYLHPSVQYMRLVAPDLAYRLGASGAFPPS
ncbi:MAG: acyltransferase family protein [Lapillicoccus sp.]